MDKSEVMNRGQSDSMEVNLDTESFSMQNKFLEVRSEEEPVGILKQVQNRSSPIRRVKFVDESDGSDSSSDEEENSRIKVKSCIEAVRINSVGDLSFESQESVSSVDTISEMDDSKIEIFDAVDTGNDELEDKGAADALSDVPCNSSSMCRPDSPVNSRTQLTQDEGAGNFPKADDSDSSEEKSYTCRTSQKVCDSRKEERDFEDSVSSVSPDLLSVSVVDSSGSAQPDKSPDVIPVESRQEENSLNSLQENIQCQNFTIRQSVNEKTSPVESSLVDIRYEPEEIPYEKSSQTPSVSSASPQSNPNGRKKDKPERIYSAADEEYMVKVLRAQVRRI